METFVDVVALSHKKCAVPIVGRLAYATRENFVGRVVDGYEADVSLLTRKTAEALCAVQSVLIEKGLGLIVLDAYRPLRAVKDFASWYRQPAGDYELERKSLHYPQLEKTDLVRLGYAPETVSRHCFGHAVDVSLIDLQTGQLLNMGSIFDFFGPASHHPEATAEIVGQEAFSNREILKNAMEQQGFVSYPYEYWHYDFHEQEVFDPVDVVITESFAGLNV